MAITVVRLTGTQKQITRQSQSLTALLFLKHNKVFCGHFVPSVVLRCNTAVFHEMPGILRVVMSGGGGIYDVMTFSRVCSYFPAAGFDMLRRVL